MSGLILPNDPTRIDLSLDGGVDPATDPFTRRMDGIAIHGNARFSVPFISHVIGNLYQGGCTDGLVLPDRFRTVVSLYPWESYIVGPDVTVHEVEMLDAPGLVDHVRVQELARLVLKACQEGPTLVHCQAGLNRSGLIAGAALVLNGYEPGYAIDLLREKRSPAVLCNESFYEYLMGLA